MWNYITQPVRLQTCTYFRLWTAFVHSTSSLAFPLSPCRSTSASVGLNLFTPKFIIPENVWIELEFHAVCPTAGGIFYPINPYSAEKRQHLGVTLHYWTANWLSLGGWLKSWAMQCGIMFYTYTCIFRLNTLHSPCQ